MQKQRLQIPARKDEHTNLLWVQMAFKTRLTALATAHGTSVYGVMQAIFNGFAKKPFALEKTDKRQKRGGYDIRLPRVRIPAETKAALLKAAKSAGLTESEALRQVLSAWVKTTGEMK